LTEGGVAALAELLAELPEVLRTQALTHSSWVEDRTQSYGRLAFLGDSVLGLALAAELFNSDSEADSGDLTKIHNQAVSGRALSVVGGELGLAEMLAERAPGGGIGIPAETLLASERPLAEITEAVIGACFIAHGYERTAAAVAAAFGEQISYAAKTRIDFKSELQERLARDGATVSYEVVAEEGPPHDRTFEVAASARGKRLGSGAGRSKKEAEQAAASEALARIND
jgi:ribonuclease III